MASEQSFFSKLISLFLLLIHLGCFTLGTTDNESLMRKKRKVSPLSASPSPSSLKTRRALSSSWSYLRRIFLSKSCIKDSIAHHPTTPISARSSQQSAAPIVAAEALFGSDSPPQGRCGSVQESDISADNPFFPLRNDIFPCPVCGEIFQKSQILEQHQSIKHAVSELHEGDSGKNIVKIIFKMGWTEKEKNLQIHRVLKIHNSPKILARFEEYRENVKLKAAKNGVVRRLDERCIADGNELLRFHCSTFLCNLGQNGNSSICNNQYCSVCGIIRAGFSPKMDGISTLSSSWRAHVAIPEEIEEEFAFMNVRRAMLVCRVVAGRVGSEQDDEVDKDDGGFDSVVGRGSGPHIRLDEEELLVFNPRAVLPCFVIVYTV